ncbi:MAG TPA: c-type cytochrome domain-containing protein [Planctomycetota bacterium]|nr:c-type cytochrome domain-containing protein [Planctomycetota bacterium]
MAQLPAPTPAPALKPVSYWQQVRPLLQGRCVGCHQPAKAKGELVLTDYHSLLAARQDKDPVVVPGEPDAGQLLAVITAHDGKPPEMPKLGAPLALADVELLRRWLSEGAVDDSPKALGPLITMANPPVYTKAPVVTSLDYSPDGALLAVSGYHEVLLRSSDGQQLLARLVGLAERIESVAFSPDGTHLAVAGGSPARMGELQIWDVATRRLELSVTATFDSLYGVSWSPDGRRVAFGAADKAVRAIDSKTGEQVLYQATHDDLVLDTVFSKDGSHLITVSRDRTMKLIHVATQQFIDDITSITPGALKGGLMAVARHPARDELLIGGADGTPKLYKMFRDKARKIGDDFNLIRAFAAMPGRVFAVAFSSDGERIVAGSSSSGSGEVRVYHPCDGKQLWRYESPCGIYTVAFRPDGELVAVSGFDGNVVLLDAETGARVRQFPAVPLGSAVPIGQDPPAPSLPAPSLPAPPAPTTGLQTPAGPRQ